MKVHIYIDVAPPFGCGTSSMACAHTAKAIVYIMRKRSHHTICYLDDFVGDAATAKEAKAAYADIIKVTAKLGLDLSFQKCVPPSTEVEGLGFSVSTTEMTIKIPDDRLHDVITECEAWKNKVMASQHEIQRLVGWLQHVARCVRPA